MTYEGDCPFCPGKFAAGTEIADGEMGVTHTLPPCEKFVRLDALEFVIAARRAKGIPAAPEDRE